MQTGKAILIILICAALLGACGHKGPLYLPDGKPATAQESAPDASADKEDADKEKETPEKDNSIPAL